MIIGAPRKVAEEGDIRKTSRSVCKTEKKGRLSGEELEEFRRLRISLDTASDGIMKDLAGMLPAEKRGLAEGRGKELKPSPDFCVFDGMLLFAYHEAMGFFSERIKQVADDAREWVREGDPAYALEKKREPLLKELASLEEWRRNITPHMGKEAIKVDAPTASSIPHLAHIDNQIAIVKAKLAALEILPRYISP